MRCRQRDGNQVMQGLAGQDETFGFAGTYSDEPLADFKQGHDKNGFLSFKGHSGCLGENFVGA